MKALSYFILSSLVCLAIACKEPDAGLRADLDQAIFKIDMLENQLSAVRSMDAGDLVHHVYLDLKDELTAEDTTALLAELNKLRRISELKTLSIGKFADLGDRRALADYEFVMSMSFESDAGYKIYQEHPIHVQLKMALEDYLAAPPVTYDYIHQ